LSDKLAAFATATLFHKPAMPVIAAGTEPAAASAAILGLGGEAADCTGMDVAVEPLFHCILFLQTSSSRALLMTLRGATVTGSQQGQRQHQRDNRETFVSLMVDEPAIPHRK
jgi:hypothetical protein